MSIGKVFFKTKLYNLKEAIKELRYFKWSNFFFCLIYAFINPYRVSKNYLRKQRAENIHIYGETPLSSFAKIAAICPITQQDRVLELGAGRGKLCFWLSSVIGCETVGVEQIPFFVKIAQSLIRLCNLKRVHIIKADLLTFKSADFSIIYLYGTALGDDQIRQWIERLGGFKGKIITISYPLAAYRPDLFDTLNTLKISFPWGETLAYIQRLK